MRGFSSSVQNTGILESLEAMEALNYMFALTKYKKMAQDNIVVLIPVFGAAAIFISNFLIKGNSSADEYGQFATVLLAVSTMYMFGGVGVEQAAIRLSKVEGDKIYISRSLLCVNLISAAFSPLIYVFILFFFGVLESITPEVMVISYTISLVSNYSIYLKLTGNLIGFYSIYHLWKVSVFVVVILHLTYGPFVDYYLLMAISIFACSLIAVFLTPKNALELNGKGKVAETLPYLAVGAISVIGVGIYENLDRYIVKNVFDLKVFGDYFFVITVMLAPVLIIGSYFSNKRLSEYKKGVSLERFSSDFIKGFSIALVVSVGAGILIYISEIAGVIKIDANGKVYLLAAALAIVRGAYLHLSMAIALVCTSSSIIVVSLLYLFFALVVFYIFTGGQFELITIVFTVFVLWVTRCIAYYCMIAGRLKSECAK